MNFQLLKFLGEMVNLQSSLIPGELYERWQSCLTQCNAERLNKMIPTFISLYNSSYANKIQKVYPHVLRGIETMVPETYQRYITLQDRTGGRNKRTKEEKEEIASFSDTCYWFLYLTDTEVKDHVRRVVEMCSLFDIHLSEEELHLENTKFMILCFVGSIIDQWKYSTNLVFLEHFSFDSKNVPLAGRGLPSKDELLGKKFFPLRLQICFNIMRSKKNREKPINQQLIYTVFQGVKKGLLPVRPEKVLSNLFDHARALGTQKSPLSDAQREVVERTTNDIFSKAATIGDTLSSNNQISTKSTIESNYSEFGALGALLRRAGSFRFNADEKGYDTCIGRLNEEFYGFGHKGRDWEIFELRGPWMSNEEIYQFAREEAYKSLFETPKSAPSCILEPMKVRIITKPKWNQYLCMKDIQKTWWRHLKDHSSGFFDLIGRPVNEADIASVINNTPYSWNIVSGDYSAATDNLKMEVTMTILKRLMSGTSDMRNFLMCRNALTGGVVEYNFNKIIPQSDWVPNEKNSPTISDRFLPLFEQEEEKGGFEFVPDVCKKGLVLSRSVQQVNGQLMGSIISFILLCIANLAAYRYAIETYENRRISLKEMKKRRPVKINGDDILFSCEQEFYTHWCKTIREFGFEPSPGKNLYHKDYCQINSVLYRIDRYLCKPMHHTDIHRIRGFNRSESYWLSFLEEHNLETTQVVVPKEIPYVNFGLMCNRKKQDCEIDTTVRYISTDDLNDSLYGRMKSIDKVQGTLLEKLSPALQARANPIFWSHQEGWVKKCFPGLNPFISKRAGGLGLNDIGIELEETAQMAQVRRELCKLSRSSKDFDLKSSLLGIRSEDKLVALIREEAGGFFPALRLRDLGDEIVNPFGVNESSTPEWSPVNSWYRLRKKAKKLPDVACVSLTAEQWEERERKSKEEAEIQAIKDYYSEKLNLGLTHKRIMRFLSPEPYRVAIQHEIETATSRWNSGEDLELSEHLFVKRGVEQEISILESLLKSQ